MMQPAEYRATIVAAEGDPRKAGLTQALHAALEGSGAPDVIRLHTEGPHDPAVPRVVVVLWDEALPIADVDRVVAEAHAHGELVLPIVETTGALPDGGLPTSLENLNLLSWQSDGAAGIASVCLRELGMTERERRVFISHRRADGMIAAQQIHDALGHAGWKAFVDRFDIGPGQVFQSEIEVALEDMAFLLLLETPGAPESEWVQKEVLYALSNTMGIAVVNVGNAPRIATAQDLLPHFVAERSTTLDGSQIRLTEEALTDIVGHVERAHSRALVRRRMSLLLSAQMSATEAGLSVAAVPEWRIRITGQDVSEVLEGVPRLPKIEDLHRLQSACGGMDTGVLVHSAHRLPQSRRDLIRWAMHDRPLELVPGNAIGARWQGREP